MAAGAVHLHRQERPAENVCLGGHRHVVLRSQCEAAGAAKVGAAAHHDQFGHHPIDRLAVEKRLVDPEAKRPGVVERGVNEVGVLSEHVLPVAHPVVGPARIGDEGIDEPVAAIGPGVGQKRLDLLRRRHDAADVEREPADEGRIVGKRRRRDVGGDQAGVDESVDGVVHRPRVLGMIDWNLGHRGARRRFDKLTGLIMSLLPEVRLFRRRGPPGGGVVCHPLGIQSCREVGPARVGERDPFVGGRDDRRHLARRPDARGELPCLRPPTLTAHTNLDMEDVSSAVAHHLHDSLLVARLHDPHAGRPRTVRHEHFFMAVRSLLRRFDLGHPFSIKKHPGRAPRPHRDLLRTLWQGDVAADPHDERCCAVGP